MWYALDKDKNPYPIDLMKQTPRERIEWERNKIVCQETVFNIRGWKPVKELVSTIFLGLDHGRIGNKPILWETMSFNRSMDDITKFDDMWSEKEFDRYETYQDAVEGHKHIKNIIHGQLVSQLWKALIPSTIFIYAIIKLSQVSG